MKTKTMVLLTVLGIAFLALAFIGFQIYGKKTFNPGTKILAKKHTGIIYCSYGNDGVKQLVDITAKKINADVIELKSAVPYPADNAEFIKRIDAENNDVSKIILDNKIIDLRKYKLLVFATPVIQKKPCPVMHKFINDNKDRLNKKAVTTIIKYKKGADSTETSKYFFYKFYHASRKPSFLTFAENKDQLLYELQLWLDQMEFTHEELR